MAGFTAVQAHPTFVPRKASASLQKPVVLPATEVTPHGFTANWEKVDNAEAYCVFVYTEHIAPHDETFAVVSEDFDLIDFGTIESPVWGDELYEVLDPYTTLPNWSVYGYTTYVQGMVGGVIYSPYMDLRNDEGKYQVTLTVYAVAGDEVFVHTDGTEKQEQSFKITETGLTTFTLSFTNGRQDTFFYLNNTTSNNFYLDAATVTQELKAGDKAYVMVDLNDAVTEGKTSADFKQLRYAPDAHKVFYDLYAVVREYNDPDDPSRYEQAYSDFSDKMEVVLTPETSLNNLENTSIPFYTTAQGITLQLAEDALVQIYNLAGEQVVSRSYAAGIHPLPLPGGFYLLHLNGTTFKLTIQQQ